MSQTISDQKKALRKKLKPLRDAIAGEERESASEQLSEIDLAPLGLKPGTIISGYVPIRSECNCLPLMEKLRALGMRIALPLILGDEQPLKFKEWLDGTDLVPGDFNIPTTPDNAPEVRPDVLLVPLLAFDKLGRRTGYGKGHYDRTLADLRNNAKVAAIGVAFDIQEVPEVPCDEYDQRLDWIITPSGLRKCGE